MNFTREIKRELMKKPPADRAGLLSLLSSAFETSGAVHLGDRAGFYFTSESEETAKFLLSAVERAFGIEMTLAGAVRDPKHGRDKLTFSYEGENAADFARELLAVKPDETIGGEYLKGAFLGGGSCTLPRSGTKTGYHLEIIFEHPDAAEKFLLCSEEFQLLCSSLERGGKVVVYLKNREGISDFLAIIGAENALSTLEGVSSARQESNNENRKSNCFAGNADKAAIASAEQVLLIGRLKESGKLSSLPEPLRTAAQERLAHPELSLSELSESMGLSKSCLYHRMRKLTQIAKRP